mmetsp:Transcript_42530/g.106744  ORF Transcript_42530/g.106744 Transcript_42530/m.106744 type:complete len:221 (-) Transcript_42530:552-1214(-)
MTDPVESPAGLPSRLAARLRLQVVVLRAGRLRVEQLKAAARGGGRAARAGGGEEVHDGLVLQQARLYVHRQLDRIAHHVRPLLHLLVLPVALEQAAVRHLQHAHLQVGVVHEVDAPEVPAPEGAELVAGVPDARRAGGGGLGKGREGGARGLEAGEDGVLHVGQRVRPEEVGPLVLARHVGVELLKGPGVKAVVLRVPGLVRLRDLLAGDVHVAGVVVEQ